MLRKDFISDIAENADIKRKDAEKVFNYIFEHLAEIMDDGDELLVKGFGKFYVKRRGPRKGRNIRTGQPVTIPECNVPVWRPSESLKKQLNG